MHLEPYTLYLVAYTRVYNPIPTAGALHLHARDAMTYSFYPIPHSLYPILTSLECVPSGLLRYISYRTLNPLHIIPHHASAVTESIKPHIGERSVLLNTLHQIYNLEHRTKHV